MGLRIEVHFLPSSVLGFWIVLDTGIVKVVHEAMMYLRAVVLDSAIFGGLAGLDDNLKKAEDMKSPRGY
jgi:hypothetical protein